MAPTTYPPYLREKARRLRRERKLTIDQLAECLALPRTTIYYWVRDLPIPRTDRQNRSQRKAVRVTRTKHRRLREAAYAEGQASYAALSDDGHFRDFVVLYIAEGYKRCRNTVSVANSDPAVIRAVAPWMRRFGTNPVTYRLQYHADQNVDDLRRFWGQELGVGPELIRVQRKSNSNQLAARKWRSRYGVLSVVCRDTYFRARLRAWMDYVRDDWLHSGGFGV
jgi:transcriptional regulator with XRE-family HTH domain